MTFREYFFAAIAVSALSCSAVYAAPPDCPPGDNGCQKPQPGAARQNDNGMQDRKGMQDNKMRGPDAPNRDGVRGDAMRGDAMRGDAMRGDAMRGDAKPLSNDRQWKDDRGAIHRDRDRYWRQDYSGEAPSDRIFGALRHKGYSRFDGTPYWFQGRFVVKSFDRQGRRVFIEVNPYTGAYIGVVRF